MNIQTIQQKFSVTEASAKRIANLAKKYGLTVQAAYDRLSKIIILTPENQRESKPVP